MPSARPAVFCLFSLDEVKKELINFFFFFENPHKSQLALRNHKKKENLILYDPDQLGHFDISRIIVPPGYKLVELYGYTREQVASLYMRAKVFIDSYVTGMERAIFESSLFNVIPLVASHGSARDEKNFILPKAYKWYVSLFSFFCRLLRFLTNT